MPIDPDFLYQYCEKEVIVAPGNQSLGYVLEALEASGYDETQAWLVVELADGEYRITRFTDLIPLLEEHGIDILYTWLEDLSLPKPTRIVSTDTTESNQEILDWLQNTPEATLIVVEDGRCAGLVTHPAPVPKGLMMFSVLEAFHDVAQTGHREMAMANGGLESMPPETSQAVELHTDVDFPHHVRPGEEQPLVVRLSPEAPTDTRVESTVTIEMADPLIPEPVEVSIHAPGFRERQGVLKQTIQVYSFTASSPAIFLLTAGTEEGAHTIGVDFRHKDRLIASRRFDVLVSAQPPAEVDTRGQPESRLAPANGGAAEPEEDEPAAIPLLIITADAPLSADVELRVHLGADNRLSYELHSRLPEVGYQNAPMGESRLAADPSRFLRSTFAELSTLAQNRAASDPNRVIKQMEAIGENLYLDLFPAALKEAYWKLVELRKQGTIRSLLITSDEPWIPWEMVKPYNEDTDEADDYLAGSWQLCRWLAGPSPADRVQVMAARLIAPDLDLDFVEEEKRSFEEMKGWGVDIGPGPLQSLEEVQALKEKGEVELLHFATHGNFDANDPDEAVIRLADRAVLSPRDLRGSRVRGLRRARPIIFLNACHTAQLGFTLTGLGGWAERMIIDVRASAFIGTLWEVNDELAAEFSHRFYQALWQRATLGEAFFTARRHVRTLQPANSTWLAYTLYGDPNIPVLWG
jgi:hypothetical protein